MFSGTNIQSPGTDQFKTRFKFCLAQETCGSRNTDCIALPQQRRTDHVLYLFELAVISIYLQDSEKGTGDKGRGTRKKGLGARDEGDER
jgi:hypothetical protein